MIVSLSVCYVLATAEVCFYSGTHPEPELNLFLQLLGSCMPWPDAVLVLTLVVVCA